MSLNCVYVIYNTDIYKRHNYAQNNSIYNIEHLYVVVSPTRYIITLCGVNQFLELSNTCHTKIMGNIICIIGSSFFIPAG